MYSCGAFFCLEIPITMTNLNNLYIIILAGGKGRRLWPASRRDKPKQFIDFFGTGETLLQTAAHRAAKVVGEDHILVVCNEQYTDLVKEQLQWLSESHILAEPVHRNTGPASAWAVHRVMIESGDDAVVALMPADQIILHEDRFHAAMEVGGRFVSANDSVLIMGATPSRTEPGYGYIQVASTELNDGKQIAMSENGGATSQQHLFPVKSFIEKPDRDMAKMLIESGEFLWNTGIYMARVGYFRSEMKKLLPVVLRDVRGDVEEEKSFIRDNYARYPNLSLDHAVLEKMSNRTVMHSDFGWADIGTWHGIYEAIHHDSNDNVMVNAGAKLIAENSSNNVIFAESGKLVVMSGMEGYIVAEKDNVLFICPKQDSSAMVRRYLGKIENEDDMERYY